jgi:ABC-type molybdenum transport system ATPase subunit/photorepair protein PhrA
MLLSMRNIGKSFSGIPVLQNVSFDLRPGEVHILAGENGAGKTTLIKLPAYGLQGSVFSHSNPRAQAWLLPALDTVGFSSLAIPSGSSMRSEGPIGTGPGRQRPSNG